MKRAMLVALVLLGCGEGGGGGEAQAPSEAPLCEPPELTCEHPQRDEGAGDRYQLSCGSTEDDAVFVDMVGDAVAGYHKPVGIIVNCWPGGTVATLDQPNTPTACYDQDGKRTDCEPIAGGGWADAWGFR